MSIKSFESYAIEAWLEDGLTIPIRSQLSRIKRERVAPWIVGVAATVAVAVSNAITMETSASQELRSSFGENSRAVASAPIDPDLIVEPPNEFWTRAIDNLRKLKPVVTTFEDPPILI